MVNRQSHGAINSPEAVVGEKGGKGTLEDFSLPHVQEAAHRPEPTGSHYKEEGYNTFWSECHVVV